jgi:hypothetical protein
MTIIVIIFRKEKKISTTFATLAHEVNVADVVVVAAAAALLIT